MLTREAGAVVITEKIALKCHSYGINFLLTERKGRFGEYSLKAVAAKNRPFVYDVQDDIIGQHKVNGNGKNVIFSEKKIQ